MESINVSLQKLNMPQHLKKRMKEFIKDQQTKSYNQSKEKESYLEIDSEYRCGKCRDLTFIIDKGVAVPCECRALREAEDILKNSGISSEFRDKTFDNFNYSYDVQVFNAYKSATKYVRDFDCIEKERNNSIMFMGQVGSGKTNLSLAICNCLMDKGVGILYMGYRDVIVRVKQNIMDDVYYHKVMNRYKNCRVLLIDDLFKGSVSGSDINIIFELVNHRYFNNLPVIVSSEKSFDEILEIDEAIGSRLLEMCRGYGVEIRGRRLNYRIHSK